MTTHCVYITAADRDEAMMIARTLVEERLAAGANVLDGATSFFWWDDQLNERAEAVVIAKTSEARLEPLIERAKALHSYDCPCVIAWPITAGNTGYLEWTVAETQSP